MIKTTEELETAKTAMSVNDQRDELVIGCDTWPITYDPGQQGGQMTRWPNGRGAICLGGDSDWGDWGDDVLTLDNPSEDGSVRYDEHGERRYTAVDLEDANDAMAEAAQRGDDQRIDDIWSPIASRLSATPFDPSRWEEAEGYGPDFIGGLPTGELVVWGDEHPIPGAQCSWRPFCIRAAAPGGRKSETSR